MIREPSGQGPMSPPSEPAWSLVLPKNGTACSAYDGLKAVNDIDNWAVPAEFENGAMGQIETSRNSPYGHHVETEMYRSDGVTVQCTDWFFEFWEPMSLAEMQDFVDCIVEDRQPLIGLEDGHKAVEWAYAATEAVREQKIVYLNSQDS